MNNLREILLTPYGIIIAICVVLYILPFVLNIDPTYFNSFGWKDNFAIKDGEWYRFITSVFLHGSFWHILLNMYSLYSVSPFLNQILSFENQNVNLAFITIFFVSGICGSLASFYFGQANSLGASGAIFGLVGTIAAFAVLRGQMGILQNFLFILAINIFYGFSTPGIDNNAHFGGLAGGFATGLLLFMFE
jgi:rhomboid protease GluP